MALFFSFFFNNCRPYLIAFMVVLCPLLDPLKSFSVSNCTNIDFSNHKTNDNCKKITNTNKENTIDKY